MTDYLLSCDWGTSNLRVRNIEVNSGKIIASIALEEGIGKVYASWQQNTTISRLFYYREYLKRAIYQLSINTGSDLKGTPLIVSGMASSRNGLEELPYASIPFSLNGQDIVYKRYPVSKDFEHPTWVLSGVQGGIDVMRGEEVQMIGMMTSINERNYTTIFPGTHSKHIWVEDEKIISFQTFMTGELFQLLGEHGMLSNSIQESTLDSTGKEEAFTKGVEMGKQGNLLNSLFSVRVNELLRAVDKKENWYFLSGLLIGYELKELINTGDSVYLCVGSNLSGFYEKACEVTGVKKMVVTVPAEIVDQSVVKAHVLLYKNILK